MTLDVKVCLTEGCSKPPRSKSGLYCSSCQHRVDRYGDSTFSPLPVYDSICSVSYCEKDAYTKGFCLRHYRSDKKYGHPEEVDVRLLRCSECDNEFTDARPKHYGGRCRECVLLGDKKSKVKRTYGEEGLLLLERILDGAICDGCGREPRDTDSRRFHIDHDHRTNKVRGILCHGCNVTLGFFADSSEGLLSLAGYLLEHEGIIDKNGDSTHCNDSENVIFEEQDWQYAIAVEAQSTTKKK